MEEEEKMASVKNKDSFQDQLTRVRRELIKRTSGAVLEGLLDKLRAQRPPVINIGEAEEIMQRSNVVQHQVRSLVDAVLKKGDKACGILLSHLKELDPNLYEDLGLDPDADDTGKNATERPSLKQTLQSISREKFCLISQDLETGKKYNLQDIFTDLCIIEGPGRVNDTHELSTMRARQDETRTANMKKVKLTDIFPDHYDARKPVKKVLTLGIAGVGKTVAVQKFVLDWAEETQNQHIHLIFVLPFRELNMHTDKDYSLFDLLSKFYPDCEDLTNAFESKKNLILFVLDGLDESRLELFKTFISKPTEKSSVAGLISSLIKGDLLRSSLIWVTSRPAATDKKLQDLFDLVTEIQGFSECQREEYFQRVVPETAEEIIMHLKSKRSLYIMCNNPVFCHITATVLERSLSSQEKEQVRRPEHHQEMPKTLTEMYARYCVLQISRMNEKYCEQDTKMSADEKGALLMKLGKLAFRYLEKDTLIFYEKDLKECGLEVKSGALKAGLCTQIFKKETAECGESMFSFVHLSVQEFLAALYMLHMHANGQNIPFITTFMEKLKWRFNKSRLNLHTICLEKALLSQNGHLDLFVRFLLGLAPLLEPEIKYPLDAILPHLSNDGKEMSIKKTIDYIKTQITKNSSPERIINLFHCLNELGDNSLVDEINRFTSSLAEKNFTPAQCSTLAYILLTSAEDMEEFDLKKYLRSEEGLCRMLPVVNICKRVQLDDCNLTAKSCGIVASVLQSINSLTVLDLSDNILGDSGVQLLAKGLSSPHCRLQTLRLSGCRISEKGCRSLAAALTSNPSHLKELDLTLNFPGESGLKLLSARLEDPHCKLETLKQHSSRTRLKKYACDVTLDPNTAHSRLSLSEGNRKVTYVEEKQSYPDHRDRFDYWDQVLCREGLSGRCYWEAEWSGDHGPDLAVAYKSIKRKGDGDDVIMGRNAKSWSLHCFTDGSYYVKHNNKHTDIPAPSSRSRKVGVYLDWPAGTLSFYSVSSDTHTHLHTFHSTFTEPLYPGFGLPYIGSSSVSLCQIT